MSVSKYGFFFSDSIIPILNPAVTFEEGSTINFEKRIIAVESAFYVFDILLLSKDFCKKILKPDVE